MPHAVRRCLMKLIEEGTQMPMELQQGTGNFARTFDTGRIIGIDLKGRPTSIVTIITKPNRNLVTMFPGRPLK